MNRSGPSRYVPCILVVAGLWLSAEPAHAQVCTNDNDPRSVQGGTPVACDDRAICPNPSVPDDATHFDGGKIVFTPKKVLGACHPGAEGTFGNGCTVLNASCIANKCVVQYEALMYRPAGAPAKSPAVLLVPGSTVCKPIGTGCAYQPEAFCGIKSALLAKGYVVMEILPRGYGTDPTHGSTGYYITDAEQEQINAGRPCASEPGAACKAYEQIDEGTIDVTAGYQYLANRTFVDESAIGVFGHSIGGIRALAFNRNDKGQKATVSVAAGSESWCSGGGDNPVLQTELVNSMDLARSATYTFQPQNDVNLSPGVALAHEAGENRFQYQAAFFPPVVQSGSGDLAGDEAHSCFITNQCEVDVWAPTVLNFFRRYGVK
jgi:dienelactone hydrolase